MRRLPLAALTVGLLCIMAVALATTHEDHSTDEWPMTCVDLNDIVEAHLGNPHNVGIYQRTFGDQAETACQNDHRRDVIAVLGWAMSTETGGPAEAADLELDWPTTCVELNDIVQGHLGNQDNVGIYQNTFGDQAEAACQNDHRNDVRSVFAWAIGTSDAVRPAPMATASATATRTPTQTPTATATATADEILLNTPVEMPRAMLFAAYTWPVRMALDEIVVSITAHNDVELRGNHGLYFIACTAFSIGGVDAYFGLQTDVSDPTEGNLGKGAIFSRWYENNETADVRLADTRIPERGWTESGDYEGNFVSVRSSYQWGAGDYALRVAAQEADAVGQWYGLWVSDGNAEETWIGSLRFPLGAKIDPVCLSTVEAYGDSPLKPANVPYWKVSVSPPTGNSIPADLVDTFYPKNVESLRNTLITVNGERVTFEVGLDYIAHD